VPGVSLAVIKKLWHKMEIMVVRTELPAADHSFSGNVYVCCIGGHALAVERKVAFYIHMTLIEML
jgi:hypothetical protein